MRHFSKLEWSRNDRFGHPLFREKYFVAENIPEEVPGALLHCRACFDSEWFRPYVAESPASPAAAAMTVYSLVTAGKYLTESIDGQKKLIRTGDFVASRRTIPHRNIIRCSPVVRQVVLVSNTEFHMRLLQELFPDDLCVIRLPRPEPVAAAMRAIREAATQNAASEIVSTLVFAMLQEAAAQRREPYRPAPLRRALEVVAAAEPSLRPGELAAHAGLSPRTLARLFSQYFKMSPGQYLSIKKFEKARTLLAIPELSIKDVSSRCGFPDPNFFSRSFRRLFGISPTSFRRGKIK